MKLKLKLFSLTIFVLCLCIFTNSFAFVGAIKNISELSYDTIKTLALTGKSKGSVAVAKKLTDLAHSVPVTQRARFFESSYAKILVEQGRLTHTQAEECIKNLANVPGFRDTLSKMVGASDKKYVGHLFEINMANQLYKSGYKIKSIGERYNDTIKLGTTDIDLIAQKGTRTFAFELKNYNPREIGFKEVNDFTKDMKTLKVYASEKKNVIPIFLSKNSPADPTIKGLLSAHGKANQVKVIYGDPIIAVKALDYLK